MLRTVVSHPEDIQSSKEYKDLYRYFLRKQRPTYEFYTVLDYQKLILANWLLKQLKTAELWTNRGLANILFVAYEINELLELEKDDNYSLYSKISERKIQEIGDKLLDRLKEKQSKDFTHLPDSLEVLRTGLITRSNLSECIVPLYARMQKFQRTNELEVEVLEEQAKKPGAK